MPPPKPVKIHKSAAPPTAFKPGVRVPGSGRPKGISERHAAFVLALTTPDDAGRFITQTEAYRIAYPVADPASATHKASQLLSANPHLREQVAKKKAEAIASLTEQAMALPIARAELRFQNMQERYDRLLEISRTDPAFNKQLMDAILALEESAAKQLGQYAPVKSDVTTGGESLVPLVQIYLPDDHRDAPSSS